ncbi:MAG: Npt1/Npt2 family nucleotide transporter [Chlamydiota bacterium]
MEQSQRRIDKRKWFLLLALCSHFFIMVDAEIIKPIVKSIFLTHFSSETLPYVWLLTIPLNFVVVMCYNRCIAKFGCFRLFLGFSLVTIGVHFFSAFWVAYLGKASFFLYMWKDIYIMLMLHLLWSVINSSVDKKRAKYLYGIFFVVGTFGGMLGDLMTAQLAVPWGSERLLLLTAPIYLALGIAYYWVLKTSTLSDPKHPIVTTTKGALGDFRLISRSRPLQLILFAVIFMQVSVTVFDYQFTHFLEVEIPNQDLRSQFLGRLFFFVKGGMLVLQGVAAFLLVQLLGVNRSQVLLPLLLLINAVGCLIMPTFLVVTCAFGAVKAVEYSIFSIIKEMLYVPLSREEKFKARALVDVFAYRSSKAVASVAIMILPAAFALTKGAFWLLIALYFGWLLTTYFSMRQRTRALANQSRQ